ncbi:MAG: DoxX family membrane protein [Verrucomicrobiota bacterium]
MRLSKGAMIASWIFQVAVAVILLQTLYFKFTGAEVTKHIFESINAEPFGRYASGVAELIAAIFLLWPRFAWFGAALAMGVLAGAIVTHLGPLGITFDYPGGHEDGSLFGLGVFAFLGSSVVLFIRRRSIPIVGERLG